MRRAVVAALGTALLASACGPGPSRTAALDRGTLPLATPSTTVPAPPAPLPPATGVAPTATTPPSTRRPAGAPPAAAGAVPAPGQGPGALVTPRGIVVPVVARTDAGWVVHTPCGNQVTLTRGTPVAGTTIVLDPGHGGDEPGAVGAGGRSEAPVNLAVARQAKAALEGAGVSVVLTRTAEYHVTLVTRAEIATALHPRAFVSVHHNAEPDGPRDGPGSETYYQIASPESKRLAGLIYEEVVRALSAYPVAWVADTDAGAKYRPGQNGGDYYAMLRRPAPVVSVLAELAFISNPPEAELVSRPDVQQVEGQAVARGILRFLNTADPGSGFVTPYPRTEPAGGGGGAGGCTDPAL